MLFKYLGAVVFGGILTRGYLLVTSRPFGSTCCTTRNREEIGTSQLTATQT